MALDGLERELRGRYPKASAQICKAKVNLNETRMTSSTPGVPKNSWRKR